MNVRLTIAGREVQLTLRGVAEDEVLMRLERVLARYPAATPPARTEGEPETRACPIHGTLMQRHENTKGVWYSHYADGKHCKGR